MPKKQTHGGARNGSGRKPGDPNLVKIPVGLKLPRWLKTWLDEQETPTAQLIESALVAKYKITKPK